MLSVSTLCKLTPFDYRQVEYVTYLVIARWYRVPYDQPDLIDPTRIPQSMRLHFCVFKLDAGAIGMTSMHITLRETSSDRVRSGHSRCL